jgi:hypothetical protein
MRLVWDRWEVHRLVTSLSRVFPEKLIQGVQFNTQFSESRNFMFLWNPKLQYRVHNRSVSWARWFLSTYRTPFNVILISTLRSSIWSLPFRLSKPDFLCISPRVCTLHQSAFSDPQTYLNLFFVCGLLIALLMEAVSTSETSVNFSHTTRCHILQDSHPETKWLSKTVPTSFCGGKLFCYFLRMWKVWIWAHIFVVFLSTWKVEGQILKQPGTASFRQSSEIVVLRLNLLCTVSAVDTYL